MATQVRMNFCEDCEASINKQINMELHTSYVYLSMGYYFDRDDVALPGLASFFKKMSKEEHEHAEKFMEYQNKRGGRVVLKALEAPSQQEWGNTLEALQTSLNLEKQVNETLLGMNRQAGAKNDPHLTKFLEDHFLEHQVSTIKKLADMITRLKRAGPADLGEYIFDRNL
ncbi:ferritin-like [Oratosquilla oratoria]|uniref:ferritin-like n=1 Tax=Oratosquilla oratoria TaxID=337810 RepID=UPI003F76CDC6